MSAHVQTNGTQTDAAGATAAHTLLSDVTAGSLLVLYVIWAPITTAISSVASSPANTWTPFGPNNNDGTFQTAGYYAMNAAAGTTTVTVTFADATPSNKRVTVTELSGMATTNALDVATGQVQSNPGTGTDAVTTTNPGNTAAANEWAVASVSHRGVGDDVAAGTNFTERDEGQGTFYVFEIETRQIVSAGSAGTATWTVPTGTFQETSMVGTFKEPAAAGFTVIGRSVLDDD